MERRHHDPDMSVQIGSGAGEPTPSERTAATPGPGSAQPTRLSAVDLLLLGIAAALVIGLVFWTINKVVTVDEIDGYDARVACEFFVLDRLEVPRTADFSALEHTGAATTWLVSGHLEAKDSSGVKTESQFECQVRNDGDDWLLISLTGLD